MTALTDAATQARTAMEQALIKSTNGTDWNSATPDQLWVAVGMTALNCRITFDTTTGEITEISGDPAANVAYLLVAHNVITPAKAAELVG